MKKGFTLSEVLITLGVIGVVAAITMPMLIKSYQKHVTVNRLKKAYSELYQAVNMSVNDNDAVENWDFSLTIEDFCKKYMTPYLKYLKTDSFPESGKYIYKLSNGTTLQFYMGLQTKAVYGNVQIMVDINGDKKPNKNGRDIFYYYILEKKSSFYNYGMGDFVNNIPYGGLYPDGYGKSRDDLKNYYWRGCNVNTGIAGAFCTALIMYDGWKISDDYNW